MNKIRLKIMKYYHYIWNNNQLGIEPDESGKSRIEVDESKIVTINNEVMDIGNNGTCYKRSSNILFK
jgi:hypothetical protein